jgi:hypothetical protein
MNSVPASTAPPASVTSDADSDECEGLLKRAIEIVRGPIRGSQETTSLADDGAENSAELASSALVHPATRKRHTATRMVGRILLVVLILAVSGCALLALIGSQADLSSEPKGVGAEVERTRQAVRFEQLAQEQIFQPGLRLFIVGAVGSTNQGMSVALSANGDTAIVGGPGPNNADRDRSSFVGPTGAAWVFTRSGGVWTQQSNKLVGTGVYRAGEPPLPLGQGMSVALSADGNTAIVGGWRAEAVWVFTRSSGVWMQQGEKLVGTGAAGNARQGMSVALSADGNTAIVGGPSDNARDGSVPFGLGAAGAAWVFTRSAGVWTQQGNKLISTGAAEGGRHGMSVALSADGNTAIVGGLADDKGVGAALAYTRSGGHWTQDKKLVGTGAMAASSVALSGDGSVVMVGSPDVSGGVGAAWVFARSGGASN